MKLLPKRLRPILNRYKIIRRALRNVMPRVMILFVLILGYKLLIGMVMATMLSHGPIEGGEVVKKGVIPAQYVMIEEFDITYWNEAEHYIVIKNGYRTRVLIVPKDEYEKIELNVWYGK